LDDPFEVVYRGRGLDLGDDGRRFSPRLADLAHQPDVFRGADERQRDVIDADRKPNDRSALSFSVSADTRKLREGKCTPD